METVFLVQHVHRLDEEQEDVKLIGVYSLRSKAENAIRRLHKMPGFKDYPDGFHIEEYKLNQDHWLDGFVTVKDSTRR